MGAQLLLATATLPDTITFAIAAAICIVGSVGVVTSTHPVHSALMLVMTLFGVAVLFVEENAQFLAAVQVIVYAGAIVVLFLFVIMLLGIDRAEAIAADPLKGQRITALLLGVLALAEVILLGRGRWPVGAHATAGALNKAGTPNVNVLGASIFTTYLLPFEITSALLVIAIVGAVVLARHPRRSSAPAVIVDDADDLPGPLEPDDPGPVGPDPNEPDPMERVDETTEIDDATSPESGRSGVGAGRHDGRSHS
jgi:NADH-quinone oxidoreductase subunit J